VEPDPVDEVPPADPDESGGDDAAAVGEHGEEHGLGPWPSGGGVAADDDARGAQQSQQ
jgi:hypothetical protein